MIAAYIAYPMLILAGLMIGFTFGYLLRQIHYQNLIDTERAYFRKTSEETHKNHAETLARLGRMYEAERRELVQRNTKLLDEVAQVTGIDVVELPSFGTVYLNHSKNVREAMQALHREDLEEDIEDPFCD